MRTKMLRFSLLLAAAACFSTAGAFAQDPATAEPMPPPAEVAPVADTTPPITDAAALPAPGAAPTETAEPEETYPPAWFRIDSDFGGLQLWAGATHALTDTIGLATDIYVNSGALGEFDIGPAFTAGDLLVTPMLGIQFNWTERRAQAIVPQLYVVGGPDPIYGELWVQNYLNSPFDDGAPNWIYFRLFIDYEISKYLAIGPQIEPTINLNGESEGLGSFPVGGNIMLTNYGEGNTLLFFLGYETDEESRGESDNALAGRLTFVKNF